MMSDDVSKRVTTTADVRTLGTILVVGAHPDDESFTAAGIMAAAVENGQRVACVTATKGEMGVQDARRWPPARLGEIRAGELKTALAILGVKEHYWLDYPDGGCNKVPFQEAVERLKRIIKRLHPDTILTFGPDGLTGHPDHQTVSKWVAAAVKGTDANVYHSVEEASSYEDFLKDADKQFNIYFNIDEPPVYREEECDIAFCLTPQQFEKKKQAIMAMPSQTEALFKHAPPGFAESVFRCECFLRAA